VSSKEIQTKISEFANSSYANEQLQYSLEKLKIDLKTQKKLSKIYPNFIKQAFEKLSLVNNISVRELQSNYNQYLN